ncbi:hypothetical protein BaRGS_00029283 [Batillaria attramentaria]|uniref:Uncharacterized protein n=1 Tax=Batillaria attramentaria TaxID=370345 RepID=A0ABD0JWK4_9CAEN
MEGFRIGFHPRCSPKSGADETRSVASRQRKTESAGNGGNTSDRKSYETRDEDRPEVAQKIYRNLEKLGINSLSLISDNEAWNIPGSRDSSHFELRRITQG